MSALRTKSPGDETTRAAVPTEPSQDAFARHTELQQRQHVLGLIFILVASLAPYFLLAGSQFRGDVNLLATIKIVGALFGMFTGFALILRFYTLGNRNHLLIGLAFFVSGTVDLIHGLLCTPRLHLLDVEVIPELTGDSFVTGQFLMGLTLVLALVLPGWVLSGKSPKQETIRGALIVLLLTTIAAAILELSFPRLFFGASRNIQPIEYLALAALAAAFAGYLARYQRSGEMLDWWITASLGVNAVGQMLMLRSHTVYDAYFMTAHLYKVIGYMIPLFGFFLYQIIVLLEYDKSRKDLIAAREAALAAARAKSEFLANMSHEIRTPMNGVLGMTERVLKTSLTHAQQDSLLAVRDSATSLLNLLDDMLDFSKIEAGKFDLHLADFSLRSCVEGAVRPLRSSAQDKGLMFTATIDPNVNDRLHGDSRRIRQVLLNLIGNAIKFTMEGQVSVDVTRDTTIEPREDGAVRVDFLVCDSGIGIAEEKQEVIFEAFSQADGSTTRRFGGTGLGLAISSELVNMMGGRLFVNSNEGEGSTFGFSLWLQPAHGATSDVPVSASLDPHHSSHPATILVAEDNEINRRVIVGMLCDMGHTVLLAETGVEALAVLERESIDLVLMDVQMPEMGGLDAAREIRKREQATDSRLPVIALTAHAMPEDRDRCLEAGMDDYLAKPIGESELFATLERWLPAARTTVAPVEATAKPPGTGKGAGDSTLIDEQRLWAQVRGNREVLIELAEIFREQSQELLSEMELARSMSDGPTVARAAHRLAGSAANFHSAQVVESARNIQRAADEDDFPTIDANLQRLRALLPQLCLELSELLATPAS